MVPNPDSVSISCSVSLPSSEPVCMCVPLVNSEPLFEVELVLLGAVDVFDAVWCALRVCADVLGALCPYRCDWIMTALAPVRSASTRTDATASLCCMPAIGEGFQIKR